ncbi:MAG: hypothetical protein AAFO17_10430, partial [Pseudomonadota bacterium]
MPQSTIFAALEVHGDASKIARAATHAYERLKAIKSGAVSRRIACLTGRYILGCFDDSGMPRFPSDP